jgi:cytidylate kinase
VIPFVVAIGGPPGSGKSTAGRLVAQRLGLEFRSVGEVFRAQARERGLDLEAFGRYAESHPEVDRELDRRMQELARPGVVLEGRIQGVLLRRAGLPVRSITVTAERAERLRRLARRDGTDPATTERALARREQSERSRYERFYGIDLDRQPADLVVDATSEPADGVAERIVRYLNEEAK